MDINSDSFKKAQSIFRKYYQNGSGKRNESITFEQAKQRFNEYYNARGKTPIGKLRAKMFDSMYQKKPKFTIKCNNSNEYDEETNLEPNQCEPGSAKYLLEEGPRTFDVTGLDYFDEGEEVLINNDFGNDTTIVSKGATFKKPSDTGSNVEIGEKDSDKIYGPRVKNIAGNEDKLYRDYFKEQYDEQKEMNTWSSRYEDDEDINLVDEYWRQYHEGTHLHRKNRKTKKIAKRDDVDDDDDDDQSESIDTLEDDDDVSGAFDTENNLYQFQTDNGETYYISSNLEILDDDENAVYSNVNDVNIDNDILNALLENEFIINSGNDEAPVYELNPQIDDIISDLQVFDEDPRSDAEDNLDSDVESPRSDAEDNQDSDVESPRSEDDQDSDVESPRSEDNQDSDVESPRSDAEDNQDSDVESPESDDGQDLPEIISKADMIEELVKNGYEKSELNEKLTHEIRELYNALFEEVEEELSGEVFKFNGELYLIRSDNDAVVKLLLDDNGEPVDIDDNEQYNSLKDFLTLYGVAEDELEYEEGEEDDLNDDDFL